MINSSVFKLDIHLCGGIAIPQCLQWVCCLLHRRREQGPRNSTLVLDAVTSLALRLTNVRQSWCHNNHRCWRRLRIQASPHTDHVAIATCWPCCLTRRDLFRHSNDSPKHRQYIFVFNASFYIMSRNTLSMCEGLWATAGLCTHTGCVVVASSTQCRRPVKARWHVLALWDTWRWQTIYMTPEHYDQTVTISCFVIHMYREM